MVEGAPLLREYTGNGIEGSNPFFSAINTSYRFLSTPTRPLPRFLLLVVSYRFPSISTATHAFVGISVGTKVGKCGCQGA